MCYIPSTKYCFFVNALYKNCFPVAICFSSSAIAQLVFNSSVFELGVCSLISVFSPLPVYIHLLIARPLPVYWLLILPHVTVFIKNCFTCTSCFHRGLKTSIPWQSHYTLYRAELTPKDYPLQSAIVPVTAKSIIDYHTVEPAKLIPLYTTEADRTNLPSDMAKKKELFCLYLKTVSVNEPYIKIKHSRAN